MSLPPKTERTLVLATGNAGKVAEIQTVLQGLAFRVSSLCDHFEPLPFIPETGATFYENALQKARWVHDRIHGWVLADDSGLEVDALGGAPGVHSARYAGENASTTENNRKLRAALAGVTTPAGRCARFRCVMVLLSPDGTSRKYEGVCEGVIGFAEVGDQGFGYDPLFIPDGFSSTFAQLSQGEKNRISHRGKALAQLQADIQRGLFGSEG